MVAAYDRSSGKARPDSVQSDISYSDQVAGEEPFKIVVATSRPTMRSFFSGMSREAVSPVLAANIPLSPGAAAANAEVIAAADTAVVDASRDPMHALEVSSELLRIKPGLSIAAMFCCPHSATAQHLRALAGIGVKSFLDEGELSEGETLRILRGASRGQGVVRLQMGEEAHTLFLTEADSGTAASDLSTDERQLLEQVAHGLTDDEIGQQMFLSRHTVKHRIERLRRRVGARNRVQLAAWAGKLFAGSDNGGGESSPHGR